MIEIKKTYGHTDITGLIPGVRGQRAFPTTEFKDSDPFLMLDHIGLQKVGTDWALEGKGHDHPHRGFETITFMFEGKMNHRDSLGNRATLTSGSAQRMNAGSGIIHGGSMYSDPETERFHEMQLWINNPKAQKMSAPGIHNASNDDIPFAQADGISIRVISGELNGITGPIQTIAPVQIGHIISRESGKLTIDLFSASSNTMIYVLEGAAIVDGESIDAYQLAQLTNDGDRVTLEINENSQVLILSGEPLQEEVVFGGPFVMNTQEEIETAYSDYQSGKFGAIKY